MTLKSLKHGILKQIFDRHIAWRIGDFTANDVIVLDYPVDARPRYPLGGTPHPGLRQWFEARRPACEQTLDLVRQYRAALEAIPDDGDERAGEPYWNNEWFSSLDAMVAYALIAARRPRRIIEVGSGNSTKFMAAAVRLGRLDTSLTSIDPQPRSQIDVLCTRVVRQPVERVDASLFAALEPGDVLFIDNSHRCFMNSDVTAFFLETLPLLPAGVVVHMHDIFLPWDYPDEWAGRYYSEQYLLACWLLAAPERLRLIMANAFASFDRVLAPQVATLLEGSRLQRLLGAGFVYGGVRGLRGTSLWMETT